ncbi:MAG: OmpA family protein [Desulfuromonadaceae bacterium]
MLKIRNRLVFCLLGAVVMSGCATKPALTTVAPVQDPAEVLACNPEVKTAPPAAPVPIMPIPVTTGNPASSQSSQPLLTSVLKPADEKFKPLETVFFDFDSYVLSVEAKDILSRFYKSSSSENVNYRLEGFCDDIGSDEYNRALGDKRARSVKKYLMAMGMTPDKLSEVSYGEDYPAKENDLNENRHFNRRVEIVKDGAPSPGSIARYGTQQNSTPLVDK